MASAGGEGEGPGEFREVDALIGYRGDSLAVWDRRLGRVSIFSGDGHLGRIIRFIEPNEWGYDNPVSSTPDGGFLTIPLGYGLQQLNLRDGWHWAAAIITDQNGEARDTVGELPLWRLEFDERGFWPPVHLHGPGRFFSASNGFGWCRTHEGQLWFLGFEGTISRVLSFTGERVPLTKASLTKYLDGLQRTGLDPDSVELLRHVYGEGALADEFPLLRSVFEDPDGMLWIQRFDPDPSSPQNLILLDPNSGWIGEADLPPGGSILEVGRRTMAIHWTNEWGYSRVQVHQLERPEATQEHEPDR